MRGAFEAVVVATNQPHANQNSMDLSGANSNYPFFCSIKRDMAVMDSSRQLWSVSGSYGAIFRESFTTFREHGVYILRKI